MYLLYRSVTSRGWINIEIYRYIYLSANLSDELFIYQSIYIYIYI